MKKTDIAMIILIATVSGLIAFFVTKGIVGDVANEEVTVKTIQVISTDVVDPDPAVFNSEAINPAVGIQITDGTQ